MLNGLENIGEMTRLLWKFSISDSVYSSRDSHTVGNCQVISVQLLNAYNYHVLVFTKKLIFFVFHIVRFNNHSILRK